MARPAEMRSEPPGLLQTRKRAPAPQRWRHARDSRGRAALPTRGLTPAALLPSSQLIVRCCQANSLVSTALHGLQLVLNLDTERVGAPGRLRATQAPRGTAQPSQNSWHHDLWRQPHRLARRPPHAEGEEEQDRPSGKGCCLGRRDPHVKRQLTSEQHGAGPDCPAVPGSLFRGQRPLPATAAREFFLVREALGSLKNGPDSRRFHSHIAGATRGQGALTSQNRMRISPTRGSKVQGAALLGPNRSIFGTTGIS